MTPRKTPEEKAKNKVLMIARNKATWAKKDKKVHAELTRRGMYNSYKWRMYCSSELSKPLDKINKHLTSIIAMKKNGCEVLPWHITGQYEYLKETQSFGEGDGSNVSSYVTQTTPQRAFDSQNSDKKIEAPKGTSLLPFGLPSGELYRNRTEETIAAAIETTVKGDENAYTISATEETTNPQPSEKQIQHAQQLGANIPRTINIREEAITPADLLDSALIREQEVSTPPSWKTWDEKRTIELNRDW